jgi:hypothetical protein
MATPHNGNARANIEQQLQRLVETMRDDLDRIEILTAALNAFSRPVPDYEPRLRQMHPALGPAKIGARKNGGH